jgi:hypothetical protein
LGEIEQEGIEMIQKYLDKKKRDREQIYKFYLSHKEQIDNILLGELLNFYDIRFYNSIDGEIYCFLIDPITSRSITECFLHDLIKEFGGENET